jgi:lysyl-tRNA synthetase class 2
VTHFFLPKLQKTIKMADSENKVNLVLDPVTNEMVSKSELKRRLKKREKESATPAPANQSAVKDAEQEKDPRMYFENRSKEILALKKTGKAYPNKFHVSISISHFIDKCKDLEMGQILQENVQVAGRIHNIRKQSKNLVFYDLHGEGLKIQVMASSSDAVDFTQHDNIQRGDIVGVIGKPGKAKRGEITLFCAELQLLTPCLRTLPKSNYGFKDTEMRYRMRYLDLIMNNSVRDKFIVRAKIINYLRKFLDNQGFLEVETPMMNMIAGCYCLCRWCYC